VKSLTTDIEIGGETVEVTAVYLWSPILPATNIDPESGGAELIGVSLTWSDQPWVDDLLKQIYREEGYE